MTMYSVRVKRKAAIIGFLVILLVVTIAYVILRQRNLPEGGQLNILADNVDLQIRDVLYTDVGDSGMKWEIKADSAKYMKNDNLALFENVTMKVILQDGRTFIMTGNNGRMYTEKKDIEILGNVSVISDAGDRLTTDILKYTDSEKRISTDSPVTMENSRMQVRGTGMSISLTDKNVSLLAKVKARVN